MKKRGSDNYGRANIGRVENAGEEKTRRLYNPAWKRCIGIRAWTHDLASCGTRRAAFSHLGVASQSPSATLAPEKSQRERPEHLDVVRRNEKHEQKCPRPVHKGARNMTR